MCEKRTSRIRHITNTIRWLGQFQVFNDFFESFDLARRQSYCVSLVLDPSSEGQRAPLFNKVGYGGSVVPNLFLGMAISA